MGDDEIGLRRVDGSLSDADVAGPGLGDKRLGGRSVRILEHHRDGTHARRLFGAIHDPPLLHPLGEEIGILLIQLQPASDDDHVVKIAPPRSEREIGSAPFDDVSIQRHDRHGPHPVSDVATASTGVADQCPAERARDSHERLEARQPGLDRCRDDMDEFRTGPGDHRRTLHVDGAEGGSREPDDHPGKSRRRHEDVGAPAEDTQRDRLVVAATDDPRQRGDVDRFAEPAGVPPHTEPGVLGERLSLSEGQSEVVERGATLAPGRVPSACSLAHRSFLRSSCAVSALFLRLDFSPGKLWLHLEAAPSTDRLWRRGADSVHA